MKYNPDVRSELEEINCLNAFMYVFSTSEKLKNILPESLKLDIAKCGVQLSKILAENDFRNPKYLKGSWAKITPSLPKTT